MEFMAGRMLDLERVPGAAYFGCQKVHVARSMPP